MTRKSKRIALCCIVVVVAACGGNELPKKTRPVVPLVGKYQVSIANCESTTVVSGANCSGFGGCRAGERFSSEVTKTSSPTEVLIDLLGLFQVLSQTRIGTSANHVPSPGPKNTSPDYSYWEECVYYFQRQTPYVGDWEGHYECGGYDMDGTLVCTSSNEWSLHRTGDL